MFLNLMVVINKQLEKKTLMLSLSDKVHLAQKTQIPSGDLLARGNTA